MKKRPRLILLFAVPVLLVVLGQLPFGRGQDPAGDAASLSTLPRESEVPRVPVVEARRQAELLHAAMHATLQTVHHRYYREDEGLPIPAGVLQEVFSELESERQVKLRWLAVEGQAMNTDHEPRDRFEREAVAALKSGKQSHEQVGGGIYRRAGLIKLTNHCLKCHVPDRKSVRDRAAGLIVSIPVVED